MVARNVWGTNYHVQLKKPTRIFSKRWTLIVTLGFVYTYGESVYKITNRNAASGIVIRAKIEINDTFSCILYILLYLIMTIILCALFVMYVYIRCPFSLSAFSLFFFLILFIWLSLMVTQCPINFHVFDLMMYNDESIGWAMSYWWLIYNCFSHKGRIKYHCDRLDAHNNSTISFLLKHCVL